MNVILNGVVKRLFISLIAVAAVNGCVVVPYGTPYYEADVGSMYRGPVYAAPVPVYIEPPVYFNFGLVLGYRGGRGYHGPYRYHHRH